MKEFGECEIGKNMIAVGRGASQELITRREGVSRPVNQLLI